MSLTFTLLGWYQHNKAMDRTKLGENRIGKEKKHENHILMISWLKYKNYVQKSKKNKGA